MRFDRSHPVVRAAAMLTLAVFAATTIDLALFAVTAQAADREALDQAQDYFLVADFATALDKVNGILASGDLEGGALRDAWVLKARCEIGMAHRSAAADAYCEALRVEPSWRPDPDLFTKDELAVFEQALASCNLESTTPPSPLPPAAASGATPWYKKKSTLLIAGGVVVAGVLVAVLAGGSDDSEDPDLPGPPPPPAN
jgi:hypothetical protein